ncbi:protein HIDE1 isoform X1 [Ciconia boyciana]|uniref:protein HIDE1 isoform X1 n=1 Tax=Ciconia boyciana TaxID=52775 RepID=UPI003B9F8700
MRLELLLFVTGAVAAPGLSPPPLGLLSQGDGGPLKISCFAPRSYTGSTFELFVVGAGVPVQSVSAKPGQHKADFTLDGATPASRCYWCRYRSSNGSAWQMSAFSTEIMVNASGDAGCQPPTATPTGQPLPTSTALWQGRSWLLPVAVSVAGLVLLLLAAAAAAAWQVEARRQRAKRQQASCWTETRYPTTELSYDNCAYAITVVSEGRLGGPRAPAGLGLGVHSLPERHRHGAGTPGSPPPLPPCKNTPAGAGGSAGTSPASPQREPRASPPAVPHFSTFRSLA